ncbi:MAG: tetratricopeptide repeat protein [Terrimicrobiaceae bacterium]|nr:tetratricopeptide repeat protein [Terrimicrobiaceae bacterium]
MQPPANLWEPLCKDFEARRQGASAEQYVVVAKAFLESARQILRPDSPRLCDAIEIAGDVCQSCGKRQEAAGFFDEGLKASIRIGAWTSAARIAAKLAILLDELNDLQRARQAYERAIEYYERIGDHSFHSQLLNGYASVCRRLGDSAEAEHAYEKAIEVASRIHGETHPEVAIAANNLGVAFTDAGDLVRAETYHMQALAIREKCFGGTHPDVAQSLANLAVVYHASRDYDRAESFYRAALGIFRRYRPEDDPEMLTVQANYEALLRAKAAE